ncbi:site-2 protease family protein [Leptospira ilyithenensis]|uniref:Site-2 protease family protein n=1 Tax=Leptospira ilyithenensis TaxID=2484901 RepID=A0A4R9LU17_9LEPT|nr:site-2 protease family protein [Leptospira ilyithenensis]
MLSSEWPYSVGLIVILFFHEMGHYLPARYYGVKATLPYFIPFPLGPIGTMGAVIQIKERIPDKLKLFDIGIGGPIASFLLSIIAWVIGIFLSKLMVIPEGMDKSQFLFFGDSLFTYWSGQLILGPYDTNLFDISIHPLAKAGWVGLLITAINLLPFGQLDGGHVIYALFGERYRNWIHWLFLGFIFFTLLNFTWLIWSFLIFYLLKVEHPFVPDSQVELRGVRRFLGYFMLIALAFIFVPRPIMMGNEIDSPTLLRDILTILKNTIGGV